MLPAIRHGARPAPRRRPGTAPWLDRALGVSRRRRQAGYLAVAAGLGLLRPMLRRVAGTAGVAAGALAIAVAARFVL